MHFGRDSVNSQQSDFQDTPFFNKEKGSIFDEEDEPEDQAFKMFNPSKEKYMPSILSQLQDPQKNCERENVNCSFKMNKVNSNQHLSGGRFVFEMVPEKMEMEPFSFEAEKEEQETFQIKKRFEGNSKISDSKWTSKFSKNHNSEPLKMQFEKIGFLKKNYDYAGRKNQNNIFEKEKTPIIENPIKEIVPQVKSLDLRNNESKMKITNLIKQKEKKIQGPTFTFQQKQSKNYEVDQVKKKKQNTKIIEFPVPDPIKTQSQSVDLLDEKLNNVPKIMQKSKLQFRLGEHRIKTTEPSSDPAPFNFSQKKQLLISDKKIEAEQILIKNQQGKNNVRQNQQKSVSKLRSFKKIEFRNKIKENNSDFVNLQKEVKNEQRGSLNNLGIKSQVEPDNRIQKIATQQKTVVQQKHMKNLRSKSKINQKSLIDSVERQSKMKNKKKQNKEQQIINAQQDKTFVKPKQSGIREQLKKFGSRQTEKFNFKSLVQKVNPTESANNQEKKDLNIRSTNFAAVTKQTDNVNEIQQPNQKIHTEKISKFGQSYKKPDSAFVKTMVLLLQIGRQAQHSRQVILQKANSYSQLSYLLKQCGERTNYLLNRHKCN